ncbi:zinc ribbon domain-containing protein [Thermopirellula anaerolimosa]
MDFACSHCGQTLRVPDGSEGRKARCPACGGLSTVPGGPAQATGGEGSSEQAEILGSGFVPSGGAAAGGFVPFGAHDLEFQRRMARDRVAGPATGLIVCAILNIILWIGIVAFYSVLGFLLPMQEDMGGDPQEAMAVMIVMVAIYGTMGLVAIVVNIISIMGAVGMKKLRSHGFAMAAAILQMIPCFSSCWPLGLGMGIWAIIVLSDPAVRRSFT